MLRHSGSAFTQHDRMSLVPYRASSGEHGRALPLASASGRAGTQGLSDGGVALCSWMSQEGRPGWVGFNPVEVNGKATHAKRENKRNGMAQTPERAAKIQT